MQARYRAVNSGGRSGRDVIGRVQSQVRYDRLSMTVNNKTMGGDPAPGKQKELFVVYQVGGQERRVTVPEGGQLNIP